MDAALEGSRDGLAKTADASVILGGFGNGKQFQLGDVIWLRSRYGAGSVPLDSYIHSWIKEFGDYQGSPLSVMRNGTIYFCYVYKFGSHINDCLTFAECVSAGPALSFSGRRMVAFDHTLKYKTAGGYAPFVEDSKGPTYDVMLKNTYTDNIDDTIVPKERDVMLIVGTHVDSDGDTILKYHAACVVYAGGEDYVTMETFSDVTDTKPYFSIHSYFGINSFHHHWKNDEYFKSCNVNTYKLVPGEVVMADSNTYKIKASDTVYSRAKRTAPQTPRNLQF